MLPVSPHDAYSHDSVFQQEYNDVLLTIYLSSLTKGLHSLNEVSRLLGPENDCEHDL